MRSLREAPQSESARVLELKWSSGSTSSGKRTQLLLSLSSSRFSTSTIRQSGWSTLVARRQGKSVVRGGEPRHPPGTSAGAGWKHRTSSNTRRNISRSLPIADFQNARNPTKKEKKSNANAGHFIFISDDRRASRNLPLPTMVSALLSLLMPLAVSALSLSSPQQLSRSALLSSPSCSPAARASPLRCQEEAADSGVQPSKAFIEFIQGVPEPVVPDVKLTRSVDGSTGVATFTFDNPSFLAASSQELGETTGQRCTRISPARASALHAHQPCTRISPASTSALHFMHACAHMFERGGTARSCSPHHAPMSQLSLRYVPE